MTICEAYELVLRPRDINRDAFFSLCSYCCNSILFLSDKRCFREPTDPAKMYAVINDCSIAEARRRNVTASESFSTGFDDVRWGQLKAGKKDFDIYIINPYEEWELQK